MNQHSLTFHVVPLGNVEDEINIGVVVVIGPTADLNNVVGHLDVLGIGLEVLGGDHDDKLDPLLLGGKVIVGPSPDRPDAFNS